jgi:hypothetical protein
VGLVRSALLASVDPSAGLSGKVATGGRLNAFRALAALDKIGPIVTFSAAPVGTVTVPAIEFRFVADDAGATFECRLDTAAFTPCSSPFVLTGLSAGAHSFTVRATDALGTVGPEAKHEFTYAPPLPAPVPDAPTPIGSGITIDPDGRPPAARRPSSLARQTARRFAGLTPSEAASMKPFSLPYRATAGGDVFVGIFAGRVRVGGSRIEILRPRVALIPIAVTNAGALKRAPVRRLRVVAVAKPYIGRAVRVRKLARLAR